MWMLLKGLELPQCLFTLFPRVDSQLGACTACPEGFCWCGRKLTFLGLLARVSRKVAHLPMDELINVQGDFVCGKEYP